MGCTEVPSLQLFRVNISISISEQSSTEDSTELHFEILQQKNKTPNENNKADHTESYFGTNRKNTPATIYNVTSTVKCSTFTLCLRTNTTHELIKLILAQRLSAAYQHRTE